MERQAILDAREAERAKPGKIQLRRVNPLDDEDDEDESDEEIEVPKKKEEEPQGCVALCSFNAFL